MQHQECCISISKTSSIEIWHWGTCWLFKVISQESNTISRLQVSLLSLLCHILPLWMLMHCSDFGMAKMMAKEYYKTDDKTIPVRWCAPEVLQFGKFSSHSGRCTTGKCIFLNMSQSFSCFFQMFGPLELCYGKCSAMGWFVLSFSLIKSCANHNSRSHIQLQCPTREFSKRWLEDTDWNHQRIVRGRFMSWWLHVGMHNQNKDQHSNNFMIALKMSGFNPNRIRTSVATFLFWNKI